MPESEFRESEGWRFRRLENGDVEIVVGNLRDQKSPEGAVERVHTVGKDAWASVVSSVSAGGEEGGRFYEAQSFHAGADFEPDQPILDPALDVNEKEF